MPRHHDRYFHPRHGVTYVKQGFCWPAFLFGALWAAARRSARLFGLLIAAEAGLWFVSGYSTAQDHTGLALLSVLLSLALLFARGVWGNRWIARDLVARGYALRPLLRA